MPTEPVTDPMALDKLLPQLEGNEAMRTFLIPIALIAAKAATAHTCNPPVLTLQDKFLTYESPATDVYA